MVLVNSDGTIDGRGFWYFVYCVIVECVYFLYPTIFCWAVYAQVRLMVRAQIFGSCTLSLATVKLLVSYYINPRESFLVEIGVRRQASVSGHGASERTTSVDFFISPHR